MMKKKISPVLFAVLFVSGVFCLMASAEVQNPRHSEHTGRAHGIEAPGVVVELTTAPERIKAGSPTSMLFSIRNTEGNPIEKLSIHHDRILHVIITSQDFNVFAHIHPEDFGPITQQMKRAAQFPVKYNFSKTGRYLIGVDFAVGHQLFSRNFVVDVSGGTKMGPAKRDFSREKRFGDYKVTLYSTPQVIRAGKAVTLEYFFSKDGKPMTDLVPYLSAPMHVAMISADLNNFIHAHGDVPGMSSAGHEMGEMHMKVPAKFGPRIDVDIVFPTKGVYQVFGQVQHNGKIILTSFLIQVE
jgi:hypothetical protein